MEFLLIKEEVKTKSCLPNNKDKSWPNIKFSDKEIRKIVQSFNPNNAHGYDITSIYIVKFFDTSIYRRLKIIYKAWLKMERFPSEW